MWLKRRGLFNFIDHDSSKYGKESVRDCQCPRELAWLVTPRILQKVETFIDKFPMAEVLTCPEDKLSSVPQRSWRRFFSISTLRTWSLLFWSARRCVMLERDQSSGTSPWWDCSPWMMEWASWEVSGKWKALKPIGLRSEKSLELMTAMSSGSSLREVSLQDCVLDLAVPRMPSVAFSTLVKLDLSNCHLGKHQVGALFSLMDSGSTLLGIGNLSQTPCHTCLSHGLEFVRSLKLNRPLRLSHIL